VFKFVDGTLFNCKLTYKVIKMFLEKCVELVYTPGNRHTGVETSVKHPCELEDANMMELYPKNFLKDK
jgi:hypothetical protein